MKGFPLFDELSILVDGIVATGANTFWAGRASASVVFDTASEETHGAVDSGDNVSSDKDEQVSLILLI